MLTMVLVAGVGLFAIGTLVYNLADYQKNDAASQDAIRNLHATGNIMADIGVVLAGAAILLAALRAEGSPNAVRLGLVFAGVLVLFGGLSLQIGAGIS